MCSFLYSPYKFVQIFVNIYYIIFYLLFCLPTSPASIKLAVSWLFKSKKHCIIFVYLVPNTY